MKIGLIDVTITMSYGGIQTAVWELAKQLHDAGHEVHLYGGNGDVRHELAGRQIHIHTYPYTPREKVIDLGGRFRRIVERYSFARYAKQDVIRQNFDWVILTKPFDFFWPAMMPKSCSTRFCYMSGGTSFFKGDRKLAKKSLPGLRVVILMLGKFSNILNNFLRLSIMVLIWQSLSL